MAEDFAQAVEDGLKLAKRIYLGKDRGAVGPPKPPPPMERSPYRYLPSAPMVYAVISDPRIVDNPDIPSYQPHVHGRCDPPALIPLQMNGVDLDVDCYADTAFIQVSGSWRVHCVMGSRSCDCRIAVPTGPQGSILGVEVDLPTKSYSTELIGVEDSKGIEKIALPEDGWFLKPHIFTLTIPQIDGGTNISIKLRWSQKLSYNDGQFSLTVPFTFPEYVTPAIKKISKKEKIQLNVNSVIATGILSKATSHPLKEIRRSAGKFGFLYEVEVLTWSNTDFSFSYSVSASNIFGGVLLQSPSLYDYDQRDMFCVYLFPGSQQSRKVFKKEIIFVVDISDSMEGRPLESTKNAISAALSKLNPEDSFNIIAFSSETFLFSTSMELASEEAIERASEWISTKHSEGGGTNIFIPLEKATEMLSNTHGSIPMIFLVTDGAVEDERNICDWIKKRLTNGGSLCPRIHTFGIGSFCNHYFLRMLAMIGRGQYDAAFDLDSIEVQMQKLFSRGLSTILANITFDAFDDHEQIEVYSSFIPDLSSESPLTICGRYQGSFPDTLKAKGVLGDLSSNVTDLKIERAKDILLDRVLARQQIDLLTAQAWLSENKQLEEKVAKLSIQTCNISEYTRMVLLEKNKIYQASESSGSLKVPYKGDPHEIGDSGAPKKMLLQSLTVGFGDLIATAENIRPGSQEPKLPEVAEILVKATSNCCGQICNQCCCMLCIQCCSKMNNQCATVLTQLCTALACFGCLDCCLQLCCPGQDGR
ncbi:Inter-alpha-trypsin inhibitor heavy chain-related isoform 1 [Theobroma cacao]|uniref:Inter-alpha-trypsin inhibitor heavy chain-related isoform 1 n=1 Tax=Theobroma cacao TaxID=3641 RepID=A0A061GT00_THECC|nr:Inter-alpha-trypsin inhibitor heavy chain-related isoform 1 [Theobroma cacao]